jgi:hypothetical protein
MVNPYLVSMDKGVYRRGSENLQSAKHYKWTEPGRLLVQW